MVTSMLLIAECHSPWENWAQAWCRPGNQLILLIQPPPELPQQLLKRVEACLDRLAAAHCRLAKVLLVTAANGNAAVRLARSQILDLARLKFADRPGRGRVLLLSAREEGIAPCSTQND